MTLASLRTSLTTVLGTKFDRTAFGDDLLDEALRSALDQIWREVPPLETTITVAVAGYDQDISSITGLRNIIEIAWPWSSTASYPDKRIGWRLTATPGTIRLVDRGDGVAPDVGDQIRVRYQTRWEIEDLDGATSTTLPDNYTRTLLMAAAAHACELRRRQVGEAPSAPEGEADNLTQAAAYWRGEFNTRIARLNGGDADPRWWRRGL